MNDHPYMPLYFGDLLKQTLYWSGEERSLLILLWAVQWWNGPLPLDLTMLAHAIQYDESTLRDLWNRRIGALFTETPSGYVDEDLEVRRQYAERVSGSRRAAGKASGKARRGRARRGEVRPDAAVVFEQSSTSLFEQNHTHAARGTNGANGDALVRTPNQTNPNQTNPEDTAPRSASASPEKPSTASPSPSVTDLTPNPPPAATAGTREKSPVRRRRLPPDHPTEALRAWTRENLPRVNFDAELAVLRDHEFRDAHSDWDAVIRNWMRRAGKQPKTNSEDRTLTRFELHKRRLYDDA